MIFKPFNKQAQFLKSKSRIRAALAGKRGGKTEVGAIESIIHLENKPGWVPNPIDPFIGVVIAPTSDMLRRLSMRKLRAYANPFKPDFNESRQEMTWPNGSLLYGISADKPARLEGIKANFIWLDEVFQMNEQIFLESLARIADTKGRLWCTGSLGVQYKNPKAHWVHKHFKQKPLADSECFEWATADNVYFPKDELERLSETLDPVTYRQLFEICWDVQGTNLVYETFSASNILNHKYDPSLETSICIDWGFAHQMAALFFQYDRKTDTVYLFDEIVSSKMTLETLWDLISKKPYRIHNWYCDIAGNQEREQTGYSNVAWFRQPPRNVHFQFRTSAIVHGISIVRTYLLNGKGQRKFYLNEETCPKSIDGMRNYCYQEKQGIIQNEVPLKKDDDCVDSIRYFFVNRLDYTRNQNQFEDINRWKFGK